MPDVLTTLHSIQVFKKCWIVWLVRIAVRIELCFCWETRRFVSGPGALFPGPGALAAALCVGPRRFAACPGVLCQAPALCVGPRRSVWRCIVLNYKIVQHCSLLGSSAVCVKPRRSLSGPGALCRAPLCVGPRYSVWGPGAASCSI